MSLAGTRDNLVLLGVCTACGEAYSRLFYRLVGLRGGQEALPSLQLVTPTCNYSSTCYTVPVTTLQLVYFPTPSFSTAQTGLYTSQFGCTSPSTLVRNFVEQKACNLQKTVSVQIILIKFNKRRILCVGSSTKQFIRIRPIVAWCFIILQALNMDIHF